MRTAIKLILLNLLIAQIITPTLVMIFCVTYLAVTTGNLDKDALTTMLMIPAQLASQLMMGIYLWKAGYISTKKIAWSLVSSSYLFFGALAVLACGFVVSAPTELMKWIPNTMEQSFDILQSGRGGIPVIAVVGPVLEELLSHGAITKASLQQYSPIKAILLSAFLFGVSHTNPVRILPAFLIGTLFVWTYYKTASLIPRILMHILNNSLSVFLSTKYPGAENMSDLIDTSSYLITIFVAVLILVGTIWVMCHMTACYPWREETSITD